MEKPVSPDGEDRLGLQKFTDDELDKLLRDLSEFQRAVSMPGAGSVTSIRDYVDSILTGNINNWNVPHSLQCQFAKVLNDFEEYETKMLPQCQRDSAATDNFSNDQGFAFPAEIRESQVMIEEMAQAAQDFAVGSFHGSTPSANMTSDIVACCNYGGSSGFGMGSSFSSSSAGGVSFAGSGSLHMGSFGASYVRYFHCKENSRGNEKPNIRRRRKRKYKGVMETEEETARRLERTKIKNREAAAKAHQKRQAHEAHLKTKLLRLRKKNQFLKNLLMFLEDHKRKDSSLVPLKRTISGPI